jgi:hypothetical protein
MRSCCALNGSNLPNSPKNEFFSMKEHMLLLNSGHAGTNERFTAKIS